MCHGMVTHSCVSEQSRAFGLQYVKKGKSHTHSHYIATTLIITLPLFNSCENVLQITAHMHWFVGTFSQQPEIKQILILEIMVMSTGPDTGQKTVTDNDKLQKENQHSYDCCVLTTVFSYIDLFGTPISADSALLITAITCSLEPHVFSKMKQNETDMGVCVAFSHFVQIQQALVHCFFHRQRTLHCVQS